MKAIVAMTPSRVIGCNGAIPWRFPEDLRWFKTTTMGHPIVMGRKTFESMGRLLPGRHHIVLSRSAEFAGVEMLRDVALLNENAYAEEIFVIGGAEIYRLLLDRCDELLVTQLDQEFPGETYFPPFEEKFFQAETLRETADFRIIRYRRGAS